MSSVEAVLINSVGAVALANTTMRRFSPRLLRRHARRVPRAAERDAAFLRSIGLDPDTVFVKS